MKFLNLVSLTLLTLAPLSTVQAAISDDEAAATAQEKAQNYANCISELKKFTPDETQKIENVDEFLDQVMQSCKEDRNDLTQYSINALNKTAEEIEVKVKAVEEAAKKLLAIRLAKEYAKLRLIVNQSSSMIIPNSRTH